MVKVARFTCPRCGHLSGVEIPSKGPLLSYQCKACGEMLKTPEGEHCIICAFTDKKCPHSSSEPKR